MNYLTAHGITLLLYVGASVLYGAGFALRSPRHALWGRAALVVGAIIHTLAIGAFCIQTHQTPFASSFGTLSVASWVAVLVYLAVELVSRASALGALAGPLACLMLFAGIIRSSAGVATSNEIRSSIISSHVLVVLISFALFVLAACCAVFYLWQYGALKHPDRRATFRKLPPLETIDSLAYHLVAFALPLLTIGLALGVIRAVGTDRAYWLTDPHTLLSLLAWAVYAVYLAGRLTGGWRGTRGNLLLIAGLAVTVAIYFVPSLTHRFL